MGEDFIYLDNAATTFPKPECVYDGMDNFTRKYGVNAGRGSYYLSEKAREIIEDTRKEIISLVNLENKNNVIFTPSATIAINQILNGLNWNNIKNVYITPFEHNAAVRTLFSIKEKYDINIIMIPFDNLTFELKELEFKVSLAENNPDILFMSHVSNVTGYILPIEKVLCTLKNYDVIKIIDCAQSLGLLELDLKKYSFDFAIFAGHKALYGPFGIGGFIYNSSIELKEYILGGTGADSTNLKMPKEKPYRYEAGSYNIQAIAGLNFAIKWIKNTSIQTIFNHEKKLINLLIDQIENLPNMELYLPKNLDRHIGIIALNVNGFESTDLSQILDEEFNIYVRAGHHCAPNLGNFLSGRATKGTLRISLNYFNTEEDISKLIYSLYSL